MNAAIGRPPREKRPAHLRALRAFVASDCGGWMPKDECVWPCIHCGGRGTVWAPGSQSCPIEGNKMRDTVTCSACGGKKTGPRRDWAAAYKQRLADWRARRDTREALNDAVERALAKLSPDDVAALSACSWWRRT